MRICGNAFLLVLLAVAGCGTGSDLVSASGTVTLDGVPVCGAIVEFRPNAPDGSASFGLTDPNGRYRLMRTAFESGVAPGEYIVRVYFEPQDGAAACGCEADAGSPAIPARYHSPSELRARVEPRGRNRFLFDLVSP